MNYMPAFAVIHDSTLSTRSSSLSLYSANCLRTGRLVRDIRPGQGLMRIAAMAAVLLTSSRLVQASSSARAEVRVMS